MQSLEASDTALASFEPPPDTLMVKNSKFKKFKVLSILKIIICRQSTKTKSRIRKSRLAMFHLDVNMISFKFIFKTFYDSVEQ